MFCRSFPFRRAVKGIDVIRVMLTQGEDELDINLRYVINRSVLNFWGWRYCGLPAHGLPFALPLEECAGVEIILDLLCPVLLGPRYKPERHDRSRTVLLGANIFCAVGRNRIARFRRRCGFRTDIAFRN